MAKWKSTIFSDIRNKLGDQVVFSNWKGRSYMRAYVIPANPRTLKQQANRDHQSKLVAEWKNKPSDSDYAAVWREMARPYEISGYNLFIKYGRKSKISVPESASGTGSATVTITYDFGDLGDDGIIIVKKPDGSYETIDPPDKPSGTYDYTADTSGDYEFWVGSKTALNMSAHTTPEDVARINKWEPDYNNGVAKEAKCSVTIS